MNLKKYSLTVIDIVNETDNCVTLKFKQPSLRKIRYKAGQYLTLIVNIKGRRFARPYSISSEPSSETTIDITVKRIPGGVVSNFINDFVKIGDVFEIVEPMGDFVLNINENTKEIYLWGVGSGITPLFSLIKSILLLHINIHVHLIYGSKSIDNHIFKGKLDNLLLKNHHRFSFTSFYSQGDVLKEDTYVKRGRISKDFVKEYLLLSSIDTSNSLHYICGPRQLKDDIRNTLLTLNVHDSLIFSEDFELVIEPKDLDSVQDSTVSIYYNGKHNQVYVPSGKSILDAALDNDIDLPYSCQTGNCNLCKASIINGETKMIGFSKSSNDLSQNETLLCCSFPLTNILTLNL